MTGPGQCPDGSPWLPMRSPRGRWEPVCAPEVRYRLADGYLPIRWSSETLRRYGLLPLPGITQRVARRVLERLGVDPNRVNLYQLQLGLGVELEHADGRRPLTGVIKADLVQSGRIALAHLSELPDYYTRLAAVESPPYSELTKVGDLGCPGIDTEAWGANNRAPVYRDQMNRWLLVRTVRDQPDADDVRKSLYDGMVRWSGQRIDFYWETARGTTIGDFDLVRILRAERKPFTLDQVERRREDLRFGPLPMLNPEGDPPVYLEIEFAYRGYVDSLPWPVARIGLGNVILADDCPSNADWMLLAVGKPLSAAPPERSLSELISESGRHAAASVGKALLWPALLVGGAVALLAWARKELPV